MSHVVSVLTLKISRDRSIIIGIDRVRKEAEYCDNVFIIESIRYELKRDESVRSIRML